ncbi:hypothetical protein [Phytohabitans aurantiacus]|jgi:hypothetical protein|uniref:Uncharacterized protein n=1 Tax=Phytohabitans aurantiacus TaxID=3016789 RepID=A0ABQ5QZK5_9ACTN|nr:hypothetical protein [Phytohabitans aurantiacus]GLH99986.1 hypothetical protein Pa4123_52620 [Phytohabitans aurantiacus]
MNTTERPLAPYEERLLAELRGVVAERATSTAAPVRTFRASRPRARFAVGLGAAAALAIAAGIGGPALLGAGDGPAFAADKDPDGSIRIYIREYSDPKGLQERLRQLGVDAVVDYVPNGKQCREPRATYVPFDQQPADLVTISPPPKGDEGTYLRLHPELIGEGRTFVFTTTIIGDLDDEEHQAKAQVRLATGPVADCEQVPGPVLPRNGG